MFGETQEALLKQGRIRSLPVFEAVAKRELAAMQSEFEPGTRETTEIIEFKFSPQ